MIRYIAKFVTWVLNAFYKAAEAGEWRARFARARLIFKPEDYELVKPLLEASKRSLEQTHLAVGETFESRQKRIQLDKLFFNVNALVIRHLLEFRSVVGFQPMSAPVGSILRLIFEFGDQREDGSRQAALKIVRQTVEAKTLKLLATWSPEEVQDSHDLASEIADALALEVAHEIMTAYLNQLRTLGEKHGDERSYKASTLASEQGANFTAVALNTFFNKIGAATRRGVGNFVIASPDMVELLSRSKTYENVADSGAVLKHVGTLNSGGVKVYQLDSWTGYVALCGYKGGNETDAGAIYSPYVPLLISGVTMNPMTYEPMRAFMTRGAFTTFSATTDTPIGSDEYFATLAITVKDESK